MQLVNDLLTFFLVILAQTQSFAQELGSESVTVNLGAQVFYDRQIYYNIRDEYGHEYEGEKGTPDNYFGAFLTAVELAFRDMKNLKINISLLNSTLLNDDTSRRVLALHSLYDDTIDGKQTITNLYEEVLKHSEMYKEADMVFLITTKYISTKFTTKENNTMDLNFGIPGQGEVCNSNSSIGLVTDDGKTFRGVHDTALQTAVLLGASLHTNCSTKPYVPPSVFDEGKSTLSECSKKEIMQFLSSKKDSDECWNTVPERVSKAQKVLPAVYNNVTRYDVCTAGTTGEKREVRKCEPGDGRWKFNRTCQVQCCEYNSWFARKGQPISLGGRILADGTSCGTDKICIFGGCEERNPQQQ